MKQILVGKQIAYAAKTGGGTISGINELHLLATGAIACFAEDNTILTSSGVATELADKKKIYIAVGNQNDASKSILSTLIPRIGTDYSKTDYDAPVKLKKFIGADGTTAGTQLNYPTLSGVVGQEAMIKIIDTTSGLRTTGDNIKRYSTTVKTGDTAAVLTARLVTIINADVDAIVTAAGVSSNTGISLEVKDANTSFEIALSGVIENATIEEPGGDEEGVSVPSTFGEGTSDLIKALEDLYSAERGNTNQLEQPDKWYSATSLVVDGETYDVYTFFWTGKRVSALGSQDTYTMEVKVAIPSSGTTPASAFETIMAEAFGNPDTVETGS